MTENEADKNPKKHPPGTRLPQELRAELRQVAYERALKTGKEPSWGQLLQEAWDQAKSIPKTADPAAPANRDGSDSQIEVGTTDVVPAIVDSPRHQVKSGPHQIEVSEAEWESINLLLRVLRSHKPGLPTALQNNMHEFAWANEAWSELQKAKSPLVSEARGRARERGRPAEELATPAGAGRDPGRAGTRATTARERLDALEEADKERERGKKRTPGGAG